MDNGTRETIQDLHVTCIQVARTVARDYPAVEADDLAQELFMAAWNSGQARSKAWLFKAAHSLAIDLHEQIMRCARVIQFEYNSAIVRKILEHSFQYDSWETLAVPPAAQSAPRAARAMYDEAAMTDVFQSVPDPTDSRDIAVDVQVALDMLDFNDRQRIIRRYKFGEVPATGSHDSKALTRAIKKLTDILNSYRGQNDNGFRSRKAVSNATARARISGNWSGT